MSEVTISCNNHGPLRVSGQITLKDALGNAFDLPGQETVFLCRCGGSANKPFCDGSHKRNGFQSEVKAIKPA